MTKRILVNLKLKILEIAVTQLFIYQENIFILLYSIQNISIFFLKKILQFFRVLMLFEIIYSAMILLFSITWHINITPIAIPASCICTSLQNNTVNVSSHSHIRKPRKPAC